MVNTGSFIPEKKGKTGMVRRKRKVYVLNYIAYTFFFGAALTVAGLFLWSIYLGNQVDEASAELATQRQRFSQSDIERVRELDQRLQHASQLLASTPFVSQILTAVEKATPENIAFGNLTLTQTGSESGAPSDPFATTVAYNNYSSYTATLEGVTDTFDKLLFQQSLLKDNAVLMTADVDSFTYGATDEATQDVISFTLLTQVPFAAINTATNIESNQSNSQSDFDFSDSTLPTEDQIDESTINSDEEFSDIQDEIQVLDEPLSDNLDNQNNF